MWLTDDDDTELQSIREALTLMWRNYIDDYSH